MSKKRKKRQKLTKNSNQVTTNYFISARNI